MKICWYMLATLVAAIVLAVPTTASAADPAAPPGAPAAWLPDEAWVMSHWMPYDESRLLAELGITRLDLQVQTSDTRSLSDLVLSRGMQPADVVNRLVSDWRGNVSPRRLRVLRKRAMRTFTQPHLARHMFFHPYHIRELNQRWPAIFGVSVAETYRAMRADGLSYLDVAQRHRGSAQLALDEIDQLVARVARRGVRRKAMLPAEADRLVAFQQRSLPGYLNYRPRPAVAASSAAAAGGGSLLCDLR